MRAETLSVFFTPVALTSGTGPDVEHVLNNQLSNKSLRNSDNTALCTHLSLHLLYNIVITPFLIQDQGSTLFLFVCLSCLTYNNAQQIVDKPCILINE